MQQKKFGDWLILLRNTLKAKLKPQLTEVEKQISAGNFEPFFALLQLVASQAEYASFYVKVFISLVHFFSEKNLEEEEEDPDEDDVILLNLLRDLGISNEKLSALENHNYIKVVSIVASTIVDGMVSPVSSTTPSLRTMYSAAAIFIGSRVKYLVKLDYLNSEEEYNFWHGGDQALFRRCGPINKNLVPRLLLPKLADKGLAVSASNSVTTQQLPAHPTADIEKLRSYKLKELQEEAQKLELPVYGSKETLLQRITKARIAASNTTKPPGTKKRKRETLVYNDCNDDGDNTDEE